MTTEQAAFDQPGYLAEPRDGGPGVLLVHDYYGLLPSVREQADALACPLLLQLAENDEWPADSTPERFLEGVRGHGEAEEVTYPGTEHSFANSGIAARYSAEAADAAWDRTVDFLQRRLG